MSRGEQGSERKYGAIEIQGKDFVSPSFQFDRLAISGRGELLLVSLVAPTQSIKQIRSVLNGGAKATCMAGGVKVNQPSQPHWYEHAPGKLAPSSDGYHTYTHKIGYGQAHALFVTRSAGFMKVVTPESLWQELNDTRFTTPILREWMPFIEEQLREESLLEEAHVLNCNCGILSATTNRLDEIVANGIRDRRIFIPEPAAVA
jgi:hypothetical protein